MLSPFSMLYVCCSAFSSQGRRTTYKTLCDLKKSDMWAIAFIVLQTLLHFKIILLEISLYILSEMYWSWSLYMFVPLLRLIVLNNKYFWQHSFRCSVLSVNAPDCTVCFNHFKLLLNSCTSVLKHNKGAVVSCLCWDSFIEYKEDCDKANAYQGSVSWTHAFLDSLSFVMCVLLPRTLSHCSPSGLRAMVAVM